MKTAAWSLMKTCTRNASPQPRTPQIHLLCARTLEESFRDFMSQFSQSCTKTLRQHLLQPQPKQGGRYPASLQDEGLNTNAVIRVRGGADSPLLWQLFTNYVKNYKMRNPAGSSAMKSFPQIYYIHHHLFMTGGSRGELPITVPWSVWTERWGVKVGSRAERETLKP